MGFLRGLEIFWQFLGVEMFNIGIKGILALSILSLPTLKNKNDCTLPKVVTDV